MENSGTLDNLDQAKTLNKCEIQLYLVAEAEMSLSKVSEKSCQSESVVCLHKQRLTRMLMPKFRPIMSHNR